MINRKGYQLIARAIFNASCDPTVGEWEVRRIAEAVACSLGRENKNFDRERFFGEALKNYKVEEL